jgi:hypothetical protein
MRMIMAWFTKEIECSKTLKDVCIRLADVEAKLKGLEIENTDLRNKVLRKLQTHFKQDDEEEVRKSPKPLSIFPTIGL